EPDRCRAAVPAIPPSVHPEDEVRDWFRRHVMATMDVWVAVSGSSVVGVLVLTEGWIEQLYVLPGWQGARIGTAARRAVMSTSAAASASPAAARRTWAPVVVSCIPQAWHSPSQTAAVAADDGSCPDD
ncbi:MAG: hypothetical protein AAGK32_01475, partial [Actinomycetota bacterium]